MIKKNLFLGLLLSLFSATLVSGQEQNEPSVDQILKEALIFSIQAKVSQTSQNVMWESEVRKLTIPGRPVTVHLKNQKARLSVHFTPYRKQDGGLILVAQSEIWLVQSDPDSQTGGIRYYTSLKSIPVDFGEMVLFFPLGKMDNLNNPEKLRVEMAVMISPYTQNGNTVSEDAAPESSESSTDEPSE